MIRSDTEAKNHGSSKGSCHQHLYSLHGVIADPDSVKRIAAPLDILEDTCFDPVQKPTMQPAPSMPSEHPDHTGKIPQNNLSIHSRQGLPARPKK